MALLLNSSSIPLLLFQCNLSTIESRSSSFLENAVAYQNWQRGDQTHVVSCTAQSHLPNERVLDSSAQLETSLAYVSTSSSNGSCFTAEKCVAIVWFKKDLRIDDHPGLLAASSYGSVVPVYVFDPDILVGWSLHLLEALLEAVVDLKNALQRLGSDLVIRRGRSSNELLTLAKELGASDIITEYEVECEWNDSLQTVLSMGQETMLNIKYWKAPLYAVENLPCRYTDFEKMFCPVNCPLEAPLSLPALPGNLHRGVMPSMTDLTEDAKSSVVMSCWHENLDNLQKPAADMLLESLGGRRAVHGIKMTHWLWSLLKVLSTWRERHIVTSPHDAFEKRRNFSMTYLDEVGRFNVHIRAGTTVAIDALNGYFLGPSWGDDWKWLQKHTFETKPEGGASFRSLFGSALTLGSLSRRRIYHEALEHEKSQSRGMLSPFGFPRSTVVAAVKDIKSMEWYHMLAMTSMGEGAKKESSVRYWRWRGFLIQYNTSGSEGPPIVLVHGFGAFGDHYRGNIEGLAEKGNRVWALTMLGFGRSEKPNVLYTGLLWAELLRDFILVVVREPAILVGNSVGGYMACSVAGIWPSVVKSLVLLNTAGIIIPEYQSLKYQKPREKSTFAWLAGRLLLFFLRISVGSLLKKCYPMRPWRVDKWLHGEVMRASYDPGAVAVLESLFCLGKPLPVNYFIDCYSNKVLVIQGVRDPLNPYTDRAFILQSCCQNVTAKYIDAGHCPHDEFPDEVNTLIFEWIQSL